MAVIDLKNDGRFAQAGIRKGFITLSVNGNRMRTPEDIASIYKAITKGSDDKVMFISGIYPSGKPAYYAVPLTD